MRRKRMKSNLVSSGTRRRCGMIPNSTRRQSTVTATSAAMTKMVVSVIGSSDRNGLRPPPAHPARDDQAREGEGGEERGQDADAERHREAAHPAVADDEQHLGGA